MPTFRSPNESNEHMGTGLGSSCAFPYKGDWGAGNKRFNIEENRKEDLLTLGSRRRRRRSTMWKDWMNNESTAIVFM